MIGIFVCFIPTINVIYFQAEIPRCILVFKDKQKIMS
jgi:hypothetical protein